ncbi:MAG TPA: endolytic transglycosylase MltG, partial [Clostridiales bacterium]|nr:endolytic transglycosylase MltG [Clostridiales bacterium]
MSDELKKNLPEDEKHIESPRRKAARIPVMSVKQVPSEPDDDILLPRPRQEKSITRENSAAAAVSGASSRASPAKSPKDRKEDGKKTARIAPAVPVDPGTKAVASQPAIVGMHSPAPSSAPVVMNKKPSVPTEAADNKRLSPVSEPALVAKTMAAPSKPAIVGKPTAVPAVQAAMAVTPDMETPEEPRENTQPIIHENGAEPPVEEVEKIVIRDRGGALIGIVKALIYIAFVIFSGAIIAVFGIRIANDVFAFVKDDVEVTIEITEDMSLNEVTDLLYRNKIINYPSVFKFYFKSKNASNIIEFEPGAYTLSATMNYSQIISTIKKSFSKRTIVDIRITEGMTVDDIINQFVQKGIGKRENYVDVINTYPFKYKFVEMLEEMEFDEERVYRLEGYLFPDTYQFYTVYYSSETDEETGEVTMTDITEIVVIDKLLSTFDSKFMEEDYIRCKELDLTVDKIITLASIIEKEAYYTEDFYRVSAVFHNRLKSPSFKTFGSDATLYYFFPNKTTELTREELQTDTKYNTHIYAGFPPSAICNPGFEAIT